MAIAPGSPQRNSAVTASAALAAVVARKIGRNSDWTIETLIAFIAAMPAACPMRPSAVMMKAENAK